MPSVKIYKMDGSVAGEMQLSDKIFGAEYNEPLIHQAVVTRLANERQGTKSTLTRTEVRGGGADCGAVTGNVFPLFNDALYDIFPHRPSPQPHRA